MSASNNSNSTEGNTLSAANPQEFNPVVAKPWTNDAVLTTNSGITGITGATEELWEEAGTTEKLELDNIDSFSINCSSNQIEAVLADRESTYGNYAEGAKLARTIKLAMQTGKNWNLLSASQEYALDMVSNKIARILNGDVCHLDSWVDIAGYATLVASELSNTSDDLR